MKTLNRFMLCLVVWLTALGIPHTANALPIPNPTVIHVTTLNYVMNPNDGKCSLLEAMQSAFNADNLPVNECAATTGPTLIDFAIAGTIMITQQMPYIHNDVYLIGPIVLDGANLPSPVTNIVSTGVLTLTNLTMRNAGWSYVRNLAGKLYAAGVNFEGNTSGGAGGGAILNEGGEVYIAGSSFLNNKAQSPTSGGAIRSTGASVLKVVGSAFTGNSAGDGGGAISFSGAAMDIGDTAFTANAVDGGSFKGGGALEIFQTGNSEPITLTRTAFTGNATKDGWGGAIFAHSDTTVTIKDSSFQANVAAGINVSGTGGAIGNTSPLVVQRSTFFVNTANGDGGAIANDNNGKIILGSVSFSENSTTGKGGALANLNSTDGMVVQAFNVTMGGNSALKGGAIFNEQSHFDVISVTNSILALNVPNNCEDADVSAPPIQSGGYNVNDELSCSLGDPGDAVVSVPILESPGIHGGPISTLTVQRPLPTSGAIDTGRDAVCANVWVENKDVRGKDRPVDGNADGIKTCDRGAVETDQLVAKLVALPAPNATIDFGSGPVGVALPSSQPALRNDGDAVLTVVGAAISGPHAADFAAPVLPNSLAPGGPLQSASLSCTPSAVGTRTATLTFSTNDPDNTSVSYNLVCKGVALPTAGFASIPAAPGPISMNTEQGVPKLIAMILKETGNANLLFTNPSVVSNPANAFLLGLFPVKIDEGGLNGLVNVTCNATLPGLATGTLAFDTNDPANPHVTFNLNCDVAKIPDPILAVGASTSVGNGLPNADRGPYGIAISPDGKHVYTTDNGDNKLTVFARNPDNTLSLVADYTVGISPSLTNTIQVMVSPDGRNVYVTGAVGSGIAGYTRDADTGLLTLQASIHDGDNLFCIIFCAPPPKVHGLKGAYGMALSPDGKYMYVSSVLDSSIDVFVRSQISTSYGSLHQIAVISGTTYDFGPTVVQQFTDTHLSEAYGIAVSPDGANVYVTGYGSGSLVVLKRNPGNGKLSYLQALTLVDMSGLSGVFRVIVSADGKFVYTASFNGDAVCAFQRSPADGRLVGIQCATNDVGGVTNLNAATDIALSPDGSYLFATSYYSNSVVVFERNPATGQLVYAQSIVRGDTGAGLPALAGARGVVVSPEGAAIYATANQDDKIVMIPFAHAIPVATALLPASKVASAKAFSLTVQGDGFIHNSVVRWNGADRVTEYINAHELRATITVPDQANAGAIPVTVFNPAPGGGPSTALSFTLFAAPIPNDPNPPPPPTLVPALGQITPLGAPVGSAALQLKLEGTDFAANAQLLWNSNARTITRINDKLAYVTIPASDMTQIGLNTVQVFNPASGAFSAQAVQISGAASNVQQFEITAVNVNPQPTILDISPATARVGTVSAQLVITVTGNNFVPDVQARWKGQNKPTQYVSKSQLLMTISAGDLVLAGDVDVSVFNPTPGGGDSLSVAFSVVSAFAPPLQFWLPVMVR